VNVALFFATGAFPASDADAGIVSFALIMLVMSLLVAWYWRQHPLSGELESSGEVTG